MQTLRNELPYSVYQNTNMYRFEQFLREKFSQKRLQFKSYQDLHQFSIDVKSRSSFWQSLFEFAEFTYHGDTIPTFGQDSFIPYSWFPNVKINFAENLLKAAFDNDHKNKLALSFLHESGLKKEYSFLDLYQQSMALKNYLEINQLLKADQVLAAYMPNTPETLLSMLATASLGAIFSSVSCDFGTQAVLDRLQQIEPEVLVAATHYSYNGKIIDNTEKIQKVVQGLPNLKKVILVNFLNQKLTASIPNSILWEKTIQTPITNANFVYRPFGAAQYILYSSGTTGRPKCIVHTQGGALLTHFKELSLHVDLKPQEKIFFFTTCGWMMWNWLVSSLSLKAHVYLYEGSPAYPSLNSFLGLVDAEKINIWGTSPKFLRSLEIEGTKVKTPQFQELKTILSTGAPLLPEQFDFIYQKIKKDILVGSISGGTDILGCFMLCHPTLPIYKGEIQCIGLGLDVQSIDFSLPKDTQRVVNAHGELVCFNSFPSVPLKFWGDDSSDSLFRQAYFYKGDRFWLHGDLISISEQKTIKVFGRSDTTLKPGGVRIGTAEIYRQVEKVSLVEDSLAAPKKNHLGDDEIVLFVKLKQDVDDEELKLLILKIKELLKIEASPRHVPSAIYKVSGIPYTRSGKKMEKLVAQILAHKSAEVDLSSVANPEVIDQYYGFNKGNAH